VTHAYVHTCTQSPQPTSLIKQYIAYLRSSGARIVTYTYIRTFIHTNIRTFTHTHIHTSLIKQYIAYLRSSGAGIVSLLPFLSFIFIGSASLQKNSNFMPESMTHMTMIGTHARRTKMTCLMCMCIHIHICVCMYACILVIYAVYYGSRDTHDRDWYTC
jgi:hypothetical protein